VRLWCASLAGAAALASYAGLDEMEHQIYIRKAPPVVHRPYKKFVPPPPPQPQAVRIPEPEPPAVVAPLPPGRFQLPAAELPPPPRK